MYEIDFSHSIKTVIKKFPQFQDLFILPIGDLHIGAKSSSWQDSIMIIDKLIKEYPTLQLIGVGDYGDNATKSSKASVYENIMNPKEQLSIFKDSFIKRYKDRWLGLVSGNHEFNRLEKDTGIDPVEELAELFDIPYSRSTMLFDLSVSEKMGVSKNAKKRGYNFLIQVTHGSSGAQTKGGQHNAAVKTSKKIENANIYITGHTHYPSAGVSGKMFYDKRNKVVRFENRIIMTCTSWLGYEQYADRRNFEPTGYALQILKLSGKYKKEMELITKILSVRR